MTAYQYPSLSTPTSIRLLVVSGSHDAPVYEIEEADLAKNPRFEALSYTWNDYDDEESGSIEERTNTYASIAIAGAGTLKITLHLVDILHHVHGLMVQPESSGRIWIDQIAVNQSDLDERSHQVSLMQQVYGQAERTLMWIGMSIEHTPVLLDLIQNVRDLPLLGWGIDMLRGLEKRLLAMFLQESELPGSYTKEQYIRALDWLLARPYFKRAWIVQEIVLSKQPTVVLETTTSDFHILHHTMFIIRYSANVDMQEFYSLMRNSIGVNRFLSIGGARRWLEGDPAQSALYGDFLDVLFWLSSSREASDSRDYIYAFLSLQRENSPLYSTAHYRLSTAQAYRRFCLRMASKNGSLAFLGFVRGSTDAEIPSWTVDWRMDVSSAKEKWQGYRLGDTQQYPYAAAKERLHQATGRQQEDDMRLIVRGCIVDTVQSVSCVTREKTATSGLENILLAEELCSIKNSMPTVYLDAPTQAKAVKERVFITILGLDMGQEYTTEELVSMYENHIETKIVNSVSEKVYQERFSHTDLRIMHKRLFLGSRQLFGLGPNAILPGDCICIIHGSTVPLILRRSENASEYTVVGQCYYESWMYGEQVDWQEDEADEFVLV